MTAHSYRVDVTTSAGDYSFSVAALSGPGAVTLVMNSLTDNPEAWEGELLEVRVRTQGQLGVPQ